LGLGLLGLLCLLGACRPAAELNAVVKVNGEAITPSDLELEARLQGRHFEQDTLLEDLIDRVLVLQEAARSGVNLAPEDLESQLLTARAGIPIKEFQRSLEARGITYKQWREHVRRQALCDEVVRRQIRSQLVIKRQELRDYYWEHVTQFRRPSSIRLKQIFCQNRTQAERAENELELGEPFDEVAKKYSKAPEAAQGGDLGWVSRKTLPTKIAKAAFGLKKGKNSPIVASAYGYHILRVEERREEAPMSLDEAAPEIHEALLTEREQPLYRDWLFELRSHAEIKHLDLKGIQK
jgi:parvulin-like peptidyl-prolyl isomerase